MKTLKDANGNRVQVGDSVEYKKDREGYGEVVAIFNGTFKIEFDDGNGTEEIWVDASRVWITEY